MFEFLSVSPLNGYSFFLLLELSSICVTLRASDGVDIPIFVIPTFDSQCLSLYAADVTCASEAGTIGKYNITELCAEHVFHLNSNYYAECGRYFTFSWDDGDCQCCSLYGGEIAEINSTNWDVYSIQCPTPEPTTHHPTSPTKEPTGLTLNPTIQPTVPTTPPSTGPTVPTTRYEAYVTADGTNNPTCNQSSPCSHFQHVIENIDDGSIPNLDLYIYINGSDALDFLPECRRFTLTGNITFIFDPETITSAADWFADSCCYCLTHHGCLNQSTNPFTIDDGANVAFYDLVWDLDYKFLRSRERSTFYCERCRIENIIEGTSLVFLFSNKATFKDSVFRDISGMKRQQ